MPAIRVIPVRCAISRFADVERSEESLRWVRIEDEVCEGVGVRCQTQDLEEAVSLADHSSRPRVHLTWRSAEAPREGDWSLCSGWRLSKCRAICCCAIIFAGDERRMKAVMKAWVSEYEASKTSVEFCSTAADTDPLRQRESHVVGQGRQCLLL